MRAGGPVRWHPETYVPSFDADIGFWAVLGHREVQQANRDWETFSAFDGPTIVPFEEERRGVMLVSKDPPEHSRMRRLDQRRFHAAHDRPASRSGSGRAPSGCSTMPPRSATSTSSPTSPICCPMHVIADIIGIPEDDRPEVFRLTDALLRSMDPMHDIPAEERLQVEMDIYNCARELNAAKRANPADDVWSILATGELDDFELDLFFLILTIAGSETTRNALAQGLMALLAHPDQLEQLRQDPTLLPTAAEEILRWSSPVISFGRTATRDTELGGQQLRAGDRIGLFYPSANRDSNAFVDPYRFDITRSPNPHVAFGGGGPHYCLGASLARTEIQVMIGELLRRFETIEITGDPVWLSSGPAINVGVAVQSLPVRLA